MTAEFAVVLPVVVMLLSLVMGAVAAGTQQLRLEEAARAASRALARGDAPEAARAMAKRLAGEGASVQITDDGAQFVAAVVQARAPGVLGAMSPWVQSARSTAAREIGGGQG
ncbi:TadE family type IV pilus minor pilin [Arthrobacter sp. NPDC090010]|uniref:TadE family type IV pilus minor pilin n=1 Tax=Arthrobacter sp. NPDC090010 TaxID=3363942 RepID=UPI00382F4D2E